MERISVSAARQPAAIGREVRLQGWIRTRRDSKGGFSFLELNDGSSQANIQIVADGQAGQLRGAKSSSSRPAAASRSKATGARQSPAKGQATEVAGPHDRRPRLGRSGSVSAAEEAPFVRVPAHDRPSAAAHQHVRRDRPGAESASAARSTIFSRSRAFSTSIRRSSPPATAKGPARCSRSPRSIWPSCPSKAPAVDFRTISSTGPAYLTVSGQLKREIFACALGKVYTFGPTFRAENSNTSRHLAEFWMVEPEMAFFELEDNMQLAEGVFEAHLPRRAGSLRRGHGILQRAHRQDRDRHARSNRRQRVRPAVVHRSGRNPGRIAARRSSFRSLGATTCRPSTSAI